MTYQLPEGIFVPLELRRDTVTVKLSRPVKHGTQELEQITLGPLSGAHVRATVPLEADSEALFDLAGRLCGLPPSTLDQLTGSDIGDLLQGTLAVSWPMLDLPAQWEAIWKAEAERTGKPARALPELRGGYTLELEKPVTDDIQTWTRLEFGELTGRLARKCPPGVLPTAKLPWLVEELAGVRPGHVNKLTGRDLNRALSLAQLFFFAIRGTSATPG